MDMRLFVFARVSPILTPVMGSYQRADQMSSIGINPLVNSLMANGLAGVLYGQSAGDQLWGPAQANVFIDVITNELGFKPLASMRFMFAFIGSLLGFMGQVIAFVDRGRIAFELPA